MWAHRHFFNRRDRVCHFAAWGKPCPAGPGDQFDAMVVAHIYFTAPAARFRWATKDGRNGRASGHKRIGSYVPDLRGRTLFAVIDCDGGGEHSSPLVDPLGVALRILAALDALGIPAYLEKSKGGKRWHVWVFFASPAEAKKVRRQRGL